MQQFLRRVRRSRRTLFSIQAFIAVVGIVLSVALHELFHVFVHWGSITHVHLFPNTHAIVEIGVNAPVGYTTELEEAFAYGVTMIVMIATIAVLYKISDVKDTRTFAETVFPNDSFMQSLSTDELFELAARAKW